MRYLLLLALVFNGLWAKPYSPKNLDEVIFQIEQTGESKIIALLLKNIKKNPHDLNLVDELLTLYIKLGKSQSSSSYMGYAKAFLAPYLSQHPNSYKLQMHQVDILQYTHEFNEALVLLKSISMKNVKDTKPYLIKATIYQAKGDFKTSLSACKQLIFRASHLLSTTCLSMAQSHLGKLEQSYGLLQSVYAKAKKEDQSEKSWALTSLADMAYRLNKKEESLVYLQEALSFNKNDYFVLKKMSELYLEEEKYEEGKALLKEYEHVDALLLRRTVAKEKLAEETSLAKENLQAFVSALKLREEHPHQEDIPYFKMLGIK